MTFFDFLDKHPGVAVIALIAVCFTIVAAIEAWKGERPDA